MKRSVKNLVRIRIDVACDNLIAIKGSVTNEFKSPNERKAFDLLSDAIEALVASVEWLR